LRQRLHRGEVEHQRAKRLEQFSHRGTIGRDKA
jgi:hypothetical protein